MGLKGKAEHHGTRVWWEKDAHLVASRKRRNTQEGGRD
jgi:hypothetical protein